jgi:hypothetical protein
VEISFGSSGPSASSSSSSSSQPSNGSSDGFARGHQHTADLKVLTHVPQYRYMFDRLESKSLSKLLLHYSLCFSFPMKKHHQLILIIDYIHELLLPRIKLIIFTIHL